MQLTSRSSKPGPSMYIGPGSEETWNFEMYVDSLKMESGMTCQAMSPMKTLDISIPFGKDVNTSKKGMIKARRQQQTLERRSRTSTKMKMELIGSANDTCTLYGISHLERKEGNFERRHDSASVVLSPRVSEPASSSRAFVTDNLLTSSLASGGKTSQQGHRPL